MIKNNITLLHSIYNAIKIHKVEFSTILLLLFCCMLNYFIQQVFVPFLLPLNVIVLVYFIVRKINVSILNITICALFDEQLLGYYFCSLVTTYLFICFIILNCNKYSKTTFIISLLLWLCINYYTNNIVNIS